MAAITAALLGAASLGFGIYNKVQGDAQAKAGYALQQQGYNLAAEGARQQHDISVEQAQASVGFAQQNRDINIQAAQQSQAAADASAVINKQIIANNQAVQDQRRAAMELDARRQQLEAIRTQQRAQALALTTVQRQSGFGGIYGSSALGGARGQISGQTNTNLEGVRQNLLIGENIFDLNNSTTQQNIKMQDLQTQYAAQRAATQTATSNLAYEYAKSNAGFQTRMADAQGVVSQGQGLVAQGGGQVGLGSSQSSLGSTLIGAAPGIFQAGVALNNMAPTLQNYFSPSSGGSVGSPLSLNPTNYTAPQYASTTSFGVNPTTFFNPFQYIGSYYG